MTETRRSLMISVHPEDLKVRDTHPLQRLGCGGRLILAKAGYGRCAKTWSFSPRRGHKGRLLCLDHRSIASLKVVYAPSSLLASQPSATVVLALLTSHRSATRPPIKIQSFKGCD
jgi:hypothetical protein